jgi:hypothetical protein
MSYLPDEMLINIFKFVPDKMNISFSSKRFERLLKNMNRINHNDPYDLYEYNFIFNHNDPYYLSKYYGTINFTKINLSKIFDLNCLNYLCFCLDKYKIDDYHTRTQYIPLLLDQHIITNNITKPKNIHSLLKNIKQHHYDLKHMLDLLFKHESWDILMIFSLYFHFDNYFQHKHKTETNIDVIVKDIEILVTYHIMSYIDIFEMYNKIMMFLRNDVNNYFEKKLGTKTVSLLIQKYNHK